MRKHGFAFFLFILVFLGISTSTFGAQTTFEIDEETPSLCVVALYLYGSCSVHREIARWNKIPPPYKIFQGQKLILKRPPTLTPAEGRAKLLWAFRKKFGLLKEDIGPPSEPAPPPVQPKIETLSYTEIKKLPPQPLKAPPSLDAPKSGASNTPQPTRTQIKIERLRTSEEQFDEAVTLFEKQDYPKALDLFRAVRSQNAQFLPSWIFEVRTLQSLNRHTEAKQVARDLVALHPHARRLQIVQSALADKPGSAP